MLLGSQQLEDKGIGGRKIKRSETAGFTQMADEKRGRKSAKIRQLSAENCEMPLVRCENRVVTPL
jgi:hypothetical protein